MYLEKKIVLYYLNYSKKKVFPQNAKFFYFQNIQAKQNQKVHIIPKTARERTIQFPF